MKKRQMASITITFNSDEEIAKVLNIKESRGLTYKDIFLIGITQLEKVSNNTQSI